MTFGERLKNARKAKNLTQRQLADIIGTKHNTVSDWERNEYKPDVDTIELLCGVLDITPSYIVGSKTEKEHASVVGQVMADPKTMDMLVDYMSLSEQDKSSIRYIISRLANTNDVGD